MTVSKFDVKAAKLLLVPRLASCRLNQERVTEALRGACDHIDKLEAVREAAQAHFKGRIKYNTEGYSKHDAVIEALAACDDGEGTT